MIMDSTLLFSEDQAITATAVSTNVIDLGVDRDIKKGMDLELLLAVTTAFAAAGAATLTVTVQTDDNEAFASPTVLATSAAIPVADLVAGAQPFPISVPGPTNRYLRLNYTVATGPFTAGNMTASIVIDREEDQAYASGYDIT